MYQRQRCRQPDLTLGSEVNLLANKAAAYLTAEVPICCFFREKDSEHWAKLMDAEGRIVKSEGLESKTHHGHKSNPLNGLLKGRQYHATHEWDGSHHHRHVFGNRRIKVEVDAALANCRVYFSDYFCNQGRVEGVVHTVVLVVTRKDSPADAICSTLDRPLIDLNSENPFLYRRMEDEGPSYFIKRALRRRSFTHIFYTEEVAPELMKLMAPSRLRKTCFGNQGMGNSIACIHCNFAWAPGPGPSRPPTLPSRRAFTKKDGGIAEVPTAFFHHRLDAVSGTLY